MRKSSGGGEGEKKVELFLGFQRKGGDPSMWKEQRFEWSRTEPEPDPLVSTSAKGFLQSRCALTLDSEVRSSSGCGAQTGFYWAQF